MASKALPSCSTKLIRGKNQFSAVDLSTGALTILRGVLYRII